MIISIIANSVNQQLNNSTFRVILNYLSTLSLESSEIQLAFTSYLTILDYRRYVIPFIYYLKSKNCNLCIVCNEKYLKLNEEQFDHLTSNLTYISHGKAKDADLIINCRGEIIKNDDICGIISDSKIEIYEEYIDIYSKILESN